MTINTVMSSQSHPLYSKSNAMKIAETRDTVFTISDSVAIEQRNSSSVYEELSNKYNVRNATFGEMTEIAKELYQSGEISFGELAVLTFDRDRATNYLMHAAGRSVSPDFSMYHHQLPVKVKGIGLLR
ncbi:hypothetical protein [Sporosarcina obsidiansis]|uniref:hypothetical protein n=1 Tax=Sporosarcina obsidiansis TaxID=2660748 RepID=UPI00129AEBCF|nr:hypothetical protein [Sporosarcina obsidiansis]